MTPRTCNICIHSIIQRAEWYCRLPRPNSPVDGTAAKIKLCEVERDRHGACGPIGRYFELNRRVTV